MPYRYVAGEGAVVELNHHSFAIEIHEGVVRRPEPTPAVSTTPAKKEDAPRENRRRNEWEATTLTRALHVEAAKDFRLCLILNVMALLGCSGFDLKREPGKLGQDGPNNRIRADERQEMFNADRETLLGGYEGKGLKVATGYGEPEPPTCLALSPMTKASCTSSGPSRA